MGQPYVDIYDLTVIHEDIEERGGTDLLGEFRDTLDQAINTHCDIDSNKDVATWYSNDPNGLLWRDGTIDYPDDVFYFKLVEFHSAEKTLGANVIVFILIDYRNKAVFDKTTTIVSLN